MRRLAVMAHFDPTGEVGPHVRRQVQALAGAVDDLVVVSTADLTDGARAFLSAHSRLRERANYGYDFFSYRAGLLETDLSAYDEVTVCNDSYVGPLRPYPRIYAEMADVPVDFWGFTETDRVRHHVQSFFVTFRSWVVGSRAFRSFWEGMVPLSDRMQVIKRYEVGMSRNLYDAGFASAPYFQETAADRRLAQQRVRWWAAHRRGVPHSRSDVEKLRRHAREPWNPSAALADAALDDGRLPYVKLDTLRYDPYGLGTDRLLSACEDRFPMEFAGVREFIAASAHLYRPRPSEALRPTPGPLAPARRLVQYRRG